MIPERYEVLNRPWRTLWESWFDPFIPEVAADTWLPPLDLAETDKEIQVSMELPGVDVANIDVSFHDGVLRIKGEKRRETPESEYCDCTERYFGSFERRIRISNSVDSEKIEATYKDGVLKLTLPRLEGSTVKKIPVY
jgi:HSP20 family protein